MCRGPFSLVLLIIKFKLLSKQIRFHGNSIPRTMLKYDVAKVKVAPRSFLLGGTCNGPCTKITKLLTRIEWIQEKQNIWALLICLFLLVQSRWVFEQRKLIWYMKMYMKSLKFFSDNYDIPIRRACRNWHLRHVHLTRVKKTAAGKGI